MTAQEEEDSDSYIGLIIVLSFWNCIPFINAARIVLLEVIKAEKGILGALSAAWSISLFLLFVSFVLALWNSPFILMAGIQQTDDGRIDYDAPWSRDQLLKGIMIFYLVFYAFALTMGPLTCFCVFEGEDEDIFEGEDDDTISDGELDGKNLSTDVEGGRGGN